MKNTPPLTTSREKPSNTMSRRDIIKTGAIGVLGLTALPFSGQLLAQETRGIRGLAAPELDVGHWIDGKGQEQDAFSVSENKGKWVYLKCFQEWCPACHSTGFPNLQKLVAAFPNEPRLVSAVIQTTFEGHSTNTVEALRKNQLRYKLDLPFGHDPGNTRLPRNDKGHYPKTMTSYRTGGTPWVTIINPEGLVVFNDFHVNIDQLIDFLRKEFA